MIQRFEDEYPETRLEPQAAAKENASEAGSLPSSIENSLFSVGSLDKNESLTERTNLTEEEEGAVRIPMSRHNSDVSVASRYLAQEEGRMHRFGQQVRRDILRPQELNYAHGTTGHEYEPAHIQKLRDRLEALGGEEIKEAVEARGPEAVLRDIGATAEELLQLEQEDPENFEKFREAQLIAQHNIGRPSGSLPEAITLPPLDFGKQF